MQDYRQLLTTAKLGEISHRELCTRKKSRKGPKKAASSSSAFHKARHSHTAGERRRLAPLSLNVRRQEDHAQQVGDGTVSKRRATNSPPRKERHHRHGTASHERRRYVMTFGGLKTRASAESCAAPLFSVGTSFCIKKRMTGQELSDLIAATSGDISVRPAPKPRHPRSYGAGKWRSREDGGAHLPKVVGQAKQRKDVQEGKGDGGGAQNLYMDNITCYENGWDVRACFEDDT